MKLSDFDFSLPPELIAQYPLAQRTDSRLLIVRQQYAEIEHSQFRNLTQMLLPGDLLIFNNTRVMPARLYGQKNTGGKVEILLERIIDDHTALAHLKASKPFSEGAPIQLTKDIAVQVLTRKGELYYLNCTKNFSWQEIMSKVGHIPLPPYIQRADSKDDIDRYQTVYAQEAGAIAAPTAGLHFDADLMDKLQHNNIERAFVTLHVGSGTFKPVRVQNILEHQMHSEYLEVDETVCEQVQKTKARGGRVIAVGTTAVRSLETAAQDGQLRPYRGESKLFIYPGYNFKVIDGLITNFHLPQSTLLMLVCAFGGYDKVMTAYKIAIEARYRFFSYGDAMLLL